MSAGHAIKAFAADADLATLCLEASQPGQPARSLDALASLFLHHPGYLLFSVSTLERGTWLGRIYSTDPARHPVGARKDMAGTGFCTALAPPPTTEYRDLMKNPAYAIKNATIVDLADGSLHRNSTVHVADGRIQSVDQGSVTGSAARTIDAQGGYLMPGLCDAHVHVTAATFDFAALSQWSPSYSCYCCAGLGRICDGVTEVRRACRDEIRRGAHHIKLMLSGGASSPTDRIDSTQMSIEEIRVAVEETEAANIYAMAHAYTARAANRALHCGVRSIEHGNLMDDSSRELLKSKSAFLVPTMITHQVAIDFGQQMGLPTSMIEKTGQVVDAGKLGHAQSHRAGVTMVYAEALKLYQWMTPLLHLDVSTKLVQNLKLIDLLVGVGTEHMRRPRLPLVGAERAFIEKAVAQALATRPVEYQSAP